MMTKSYVSIQQAICPICGTTHDTGILLDKRLKPTLERTTVTHTELCPEHSKLYNDGFLALVEVSNMGENQTLKPEDADRTGRICHIKRTIAAQIFNMPPDIGLPFVYVDCEVIDKIQAMVKE